MVKKIEEYQVGDIVQSTGKKIAAIIGKAEDIIVFIYYNDAKQVCIGVESDKKKESITLENLPVFKTLYSSIVDLNFDKTLDTELKTQLGLTLYNNIVNNTSSYKVIKKRIKKTVKIKIEEKKMNFMLFSVILSCLGILIFSIVYNYIESKEIQQLAFIAIGGIIGTLMSVLNREKKIKYQYINSNGYIFASSFTHILIGVLSAIVIYYASKGDIILGSLKDNIFGLFILAVLGGYSERYINSIMNGIAKKADKVK